MSDLIYKDDTTSVEWKYQPHEDRLYVKRTANNHDAIARHAERVRNDGGTKDFGGGRLVATIPQEVFAAAQMGMSHNGKYKGFLNADKEMRERLMSQFLLEDDIKIFRLNDNYRI